MKQKCKHPTCTNTVPYRTKYCTEHQTNQVPVLKFRPEEHKFYNTTRWRELSKKIRAKYPICEKCQTQLSALADHIYEIRYPNGLKYSLKENNLMAVCHGCHNEKTKQIARTIRISKDEQIETTTKTFQYLKQYVVRSEQLDLIEKIQLDEEERNQSKE
ncbi:HNH endonuclease signature motif containing protein [Aeromonas salmonicida]|uniref:HNH endonuclease signature motif containing protein n=1 Tax=Aeromonas salmonicida TaxID=645 RepID=UPI0029A6DF2F|nr:HNH endonuclease [Aeromonas salmonicida]HEH9424194.1 HNH endonuclease [Aeromonas salmonicida]HEH9437440.1 HNH endonuclease [Aeromonas salmonicida]